MFYLEMRGGCGCRVVYEFESLSDSLQYFDYLLRLFLVHGHNLSDSTGCLGDASIIPFMGSRPTFVGQGEAKFADGRARL
jgi:hypothetical protein